MPVWVKYSLACLGQASKRSSEHVSRDPLRDSTIGLPRRISSENPPLITAGIFFGYRKIFLQAFSQELLQKNLQNFDD